MTISLRNSQPATHRLRAAIQSVALLAFASLVPVLPAPAQDKGPCSNATLKGEYASYISGVRFFGALENFVGISLRKYDGNGNFTEEWASFHGQITGIQGGTAQPTPPFTGTYHVDDNCTGTSTLHIPVPGAPDIVSDFVIMDDAKEVREIVTSPLANVVSAVLKRK